MILRGKTRKIKKIKPQGRRRAKPIRRAVGTALLGAALLVSPLISQNAKADGGSKGGEKPAAAETEKPSEEGREKEGADGEEEKKADRVVSHNIDFSPDFWAMSKYMDPALSPFEDSVGVGGEPRDMNLDSPFDLGLNFRANEAGEAAFGAFRYRNLARMDFGVLSFRGPLAPFGRIMLRPELNVWRIKGIYYGSAAFMHNMPSWIYTSHSLGMGYSQPIGKDFRLRVGGIFGGALSYPVWDDTYVNFSVGMSSEFAKTLLIYAVPTFYFAANNPMKTAYVGYYEPKIQDLEIGAQVKVDEYTIRGFANLGMLGDNYGIYNKYGFRGTRTVSMRGEAVDSDIDIWVSIGMTHWSPQLGGRVDPAVMVGMNVILGTDDFNSTNTAEYSHEQDGSIEFAETDFPDNEHPGPYGFGNSGDPHYDIPIRETKQRILDSGSFAEFKNSYSGLSPDEVIVRARFLGAFLQQVAYANDAYDAMTSGNIFDSEVKRIANADNEDMFQYIKEYIDWYQSNPGSQPLPDHLKKGIAVCAGIHWLMADFMRANGLDTVVMNVNTKQGMHVITGVQLKEKTLLLDYGKLYETPGHTLDQVLRFYGWNRGVPTFQSQFFGPRGYMGTYVTSEGRLLHRTIGLDNPDLLKKDFLGVR